MKPPGPESLASALAWLAARDGAEVVEGTQHWAALVVLARARRVRLAPTDKGRARVWMVVGP